MPPVERPYARQRRAPRLSLGERDPAVVRADQRPRGDRDPGREVDPQQLGVNRRSVAASARRSALALAGLACSASA